MSDSFANKPVGTKPWDVILIGSGPAALTAAIYTTRGAVSTLVLAGEKWGGQLMLTSVVDNFPGFPEGIEGPELMFQMRKQAERFGAQIIEKNVESIDFSVSPFKLLADGKEYLAKSIIVAAGADTLWLNVPGEKELIGRGVSSCAPCDAPFFKNKNVVVVGGGDSAMEEALVLTKYANKVTIIHRRDQFKASQAMQSKVKNNPKIQIIWNTEVVEMVGSQKLEKIKIKDIKTSQFSEITTDGLFVAIGHTPSTKVFSDNITLDEKGYILRNMEYGYHSKTNIPGVFVAGDVHDYHYRQAITAAGFGCQAGMDALKYLEEIKK